VGGGRTVNWRTITVDKSEEPEEGKRFCPVEWKGWYWSGWLFQVRRRANLCVRLFGLSDGATWSKGGGET